MSPLIIIQARTGSSRLPNKMIKEFYDGKPVLEILLERIKSVIEPANIIVATTDRDSDSAIADICRRSGIDCFRGSEEDVLARFIGAARQKGASRIIRICADNIFIDTKALKQLFDIGRDTDKDYVSFRKSDGTPSILTHYGFWAEYVTLAALLKVAETTDEKLYHEHVTNYIHGNRHLFDCEFIPIPENIESRTRLRLTMDTQADFDMQRTIYKDFKEGHIDITPDNLIAYLDGRPELYGHMESIINSNRK